ATGTIAALLAVAVLSIVVWSVAKRGAGALSWSFLTGSLPLYGVPGGGIAPLIGGSAILVGLATAIALPVGVCIAVFLQEFASPRLRAPGGILTGTVLAVARAAGETAPLLFVTSIYGTAITWNPTQALPSIPVQIFIWSESDDPMDHKRAWAAALVLMAFILLTSLVA